MTICLLPYKENRVSKKTQCTVNTGEHCWCGLLTFCSNLLQLLYTNGTDRALEGHNKPLTAPRQTSKCEFHWESSVLGANVVSTHVRTRVLSTQEAVVVGWLSREFVINIVHK